MKPWQEFLQRPMFVLTADQDWAPEWAVEQFLVEVERFGIPLHIFRTNPSPILDTWVQTGRVDQGWHPNFLSGSSHGDTIDAVIEYCREHFAGARTVRAHRCAEDTFRWVALAAAGIVADSNVVTFYQGYLTPLVHWTGIVRFPEYFEDDCFFDGRMPSLSLEAFESTLFTPGLKILNFHPTFVACNTSSREHYARTRARIFGTDRMGEGIRDPGRGTATVFRELIERIQSAGYGFERFHDVVDRCIRHLRIATDLSPWRDFLRLPDLSMSTVGSPNRGDEKLR